MNEGLRRLYELALERFEQLMRNDDFATRMWGISQHNQIAVLLRDRRADGGDTDASDKTASHDGRIM